MFKTKRQLYSLSYDILIVLSITDCQGEILLNKEPRAHYNIIYFNIKNTFLLRKKKSVKKFDKVIPIEHVIVC